VVASLFEASFSSLSFDNVFAEDIVLGSSSSSDSFSALSFVNVNADEIIIGGAGAKNSPSDSLHDLSFENVHAAKVVLSGIDLPDGWAPGGAESITSILSNDHISFDNVNFGELIIDGIAIILGSESSEPVSLGEGEGTESTGHGRHHNGHEQFHAMHGHDEEHQHSGAKEWHDRSHGEFSHAEPSSLGQRPHEPAHFAEMHAFEAPEAHHAAFFMPHH
jgi:hypothetical protein